LIQHYNGLFSFEVHTWEEFLWAFSILATRAFKIDFDNKKPCLVPFADLINHPIYDKSKSNWTNYYYDHSTNSFKVFSYPPYEVGQQIWSTYGFKSNSEFLSNYGMLYFDNPNDRIELEIPNNILLRFQNVEEKQKFLNNNSLSTKIFKLKKNQIPMKLLFVLSYYLSEEKECNFLNAEVCDPRAGDLVMELCNLELKNYGCSIEEDNQLLDGDTLSYHGEMAVWYRKTQKKFLQTFMKYFATAKHSIKQLPNIINTSTVE